MIADLAKKLTDVIFLKVDVDELKVISYCCLLCRIFWEGLYVMMQIKQIFLFIGASGVDLVTYDIDLVEYIMEPTCSSVILMR